MKRRTPEAYVMKAVTDLLDAERFTYWRMNAGDRFGQTNGRKWRIKGHATGTADLLVSLPYHGEMFPRWLWIEVKAPGKFPTDEQKAFMQSVCAIGHLYIVCWGAEDLQRFLEQWRKIALRNLR